MTDEELRKYLGLPDGTLPLVAQLGSEKRAAYERMAQVEMEINLWQTGLGPRPENVIICHEHKRRRP